MRLKDKIAIITGASQGIGAAFAAGFAKEGAKIVIADISDGAKTVKKVADAGSEALFVKTDVSKEPECMAMAKAASVPCLGASQISPNLTISPKSEETATVLVPL